MARGYYERKLTGGRTLHRIWERQAGSSWCSNPRWKYSASDSGGSVKFNYIDQDSIVNMFFETVLGMRPGWPGRKRSPRWQRTCGRLSALPVSRCSGELAARGESHVEDRQGVEGEPWDGGQLHERRRLTSTIHSCGAFFLGLLPFLVARIRSCWATHFLPYRLARWITRSNGFVSQNGVRICIMMQISGPDLYYSPYWKVAKVTRGDRVALRN